MFIPEAIFCKLHDDKWSLLVDYVYFPIESPIETIVTNIFHNNFHFHHPPGPLDTMHETKQTGADIVNDWNRNSQRLLKFYVAKIQRSLCSKSIVMVRVNRRAAIMALKDTQHWRHSRSTLKSQKPTADHEMHVSLAQYHHVGENFRLNIYRYVHLHWKGVTDRSWIGLNCFQISPWTEEGTRRNRFDCQNSRSSDIQKTQIKT